MKEQNFSPAGSGDKNFNPAGGGGVVDLKKIEESKNGDGLPAGKPIQEKKESIHKDTKPIIPDFKDKTPETPQKMEPRPSQPQKPKLELPKPKEKKKRGCLVYALSSCSIILLINAVLLGFVIYFINKVSLELEKKDTDQIVEAINKNIGPRTERVLEDFLEKYVAPSLEEQSSQYQQDSYDAYNGSNGVTEDTASEVEPSNDFRVGYPDN